MSLQKEFKRAAPTAPLFLFKFLSDHLCIAFEIFSIAIFRRHVRKNPEVSVNHIFAFYSSLNHVLFESFFLRESDFFDYFKIFASIWNIPNPSIMIFRNYLRVPSGTRIDIKKSHIFVVLIDDFSWNFFCHNFTKYAVWISHLPEKIFADENVLMLCELADFTKVYFFKKNIYRLFIFNTSAKTLTGELYYFFDTILK